MPSLGMILGESNRQLLAREYFDAEVKAWVKAHRERGLDIANLDDHELKMACYNELNKQLENEGRLPVKRVLPAADLPAESGVRVPH